MRGMTMNADGSCSWSCRIGKAYHRKTALTGLAAVLVILIILLILYAAVPSLPGQEKEIWPVLIPVGVILLIAVPLMILQYTASDPHEQYSMNGEFVKSGYGKGAVITRFKKIRSVIITPAYLECDDGFRINRIYMPEESRDFIQNTILERIPEGTAVHHALEEDER